MAGNTPVAMSEEDQLLLAEAERQRKRAREADAAPKRSVAKDVALSIPSGLVEGVEGMQGLPGEVERLAKKGAGWMLDKVGLDDAGKALTQSQNALPSVDNIQGVRKSVAGELPESQTVPGQYARTAASFVPGAVGAGPTGTLTRAGVNVLRQGIIPGLASEAAGQATKGSSWEPWARAGGAFAGSIAPTAGARAVTPLPMSPRQRAAVNVMDHENVPLTAGDATGNRMLRTAESEIGGGPFARAKEAQGEGYTAANLRRMGENANHADPDVFTRAHDRLQGNLNRLTRQNHVIPDQQLQHDAARAIHGYRREVPASLQIGRIDDLEQELAAAAQGGRMDGQTYQGWRSSLGDLAYSSTDTKAAAYFRELRDALDDAMERSIQARNPADVGAFREFRRQYGNMKKLEKMAGAAGTQDGSIPPHVTRQVAFSGKGNTNAVRGRDDFSRLATAGRRTMTKVPDSGTAGRSWVRNSAASVIGGVGTMLAGGGEGGLLPVAGMLAGASSPWLAGKAIMSRPVQGWLRNQRLPHGMPMNEAARRGLMVTGINTLEDEETQ